MDFVVRELWHLQNCSSNSQHQWDEDFKSMVDRLLHDFEQQQQEVQRGETGCGSNGNISEGVRGKNTHMLAERQRRKRENELLKTLKALIPYPVKRDKLSILQGAITYVQQLRAETEEEESKSQMNASQESESSKKKRRMNLTVQPGALVSALSRLAEIGFEVDSIDFNPAGTRVDLGVHPTVEDGLSCSELQKLLDGECRS